MAADHRLTRALEEREALVGELSQAMQAHGYDPRPTREAMGG